MNWNRSRLFKMCVWLSAGLASAILVDNIHGKETDAIKSFVLRADGLDSVSVSVDGKFISGTFNTPAFAEFDGVELTFFLSDDHGDLTSKQILTSYEQQMLLNGSNPGEMIQKIGSNGVTAIISRFSKTPSRNFEGDYRFIGTSADGLLEEWELYKDGPKIFRPASGENVSFFCSFNDISFKCGMKFNLCDKAGVSASIPRHLM